MFVTFKVWAKENAQIPPIDTLQTQLRMPPRKTWISMRDTITRDAFATEGRITLLCVHFNLETRPPSREAGTDPSSTPLRIIMMTISNINSTPANFFELPWLWSEPVHWTTAADDWTHNHSTIYLKMERNKTSSL